MLIESEMVPGYIPPAGPRGCAFPVRIRGIRCFASIAPPHYTPGATDPPDPSRPPGSTGSAPRTSLAPRALGGALGTTPQRAILRPRLGATGAPRLLVEQRRQTLPEPTQAHARLAAKGRPLCFVGIYIWSTCPNGMVEFALRTTSTFSGTPIRAKKRC